MTQAAARNSSTALRRQWRQADFEGRRSLIVDVALQIVARQGWAGVTVRRVALRLGVGAMTLYTYVRGQEALRVALVRRGFEMMTQSCVHVSPLEAPPAWRMAAQAYLDFALSHPHLYELMFSSPIPRDSSHADALAAEFEPYFERVRQRLDEAGVPPQHLEQQARAAAGRYWIALHGLASLAIAGRLRVLHSDLSAILDDLIPRVAPT